MADVYDGLGKSIDGAIIVSPLQLQIATGTQLLTVFSADQLASFKNLTTVVNGWMDGQQCAGKLTADRMDRYSATYHAVAKAIRPGTVTPPASSAKAPSPAETPKAKEPAPKEAPPKPKTACENGQCPLNDAQPRWRWRR
jgi:ABC-type uncharacterized transport system involved in gliding motility auxiliary subunit